MTTKKRIPKKPLSDEERVKITLDRYRPVSKGEPKRPIRELGKVHGRDPAVISKAISSAFEDGLVSLVETPLPARGIHRVESLEDELLAAFDKLRVAIVVDHGSREEDDQYGDQVHRILGYQMASELIAPERGGSLFKRYGASIALGSGRGVYCTIRGLKNFPRLGLSDLTLSSLTGSVFLGPHPEPFIHWGQTLDGDTNIMLLSEYCRATKLLMRPLVSPLAHAATELPKVASRTWLGLAPESDPYFPTHALIGVGILSPGHRCWAEATSGSSNSLIGEIQIDLEELVELCGKAQEISANQYCPVGDICNSFNFIEPPEPLKEKLGKPFRDWLRQNQKRVNDLIEKMNLQLLTGQSQLRQIDKILVVAGTAEKAPFIRQLFLDKAYSTDSFYLCTDRAAAEKMVYLDA